MRILIVLPGDIVAKTLVASGALSELSSRHELHFLASTDASRSQGIGCIRLNPEYKSSSVLQRFDLLFWYLELTFLLRNRSENPRENFKFRQLGGFWQAVLFIIAQQGFIQVARLIDGFIFKSDRQIESLLRTIRPDLVIMPGSALDSYSFIVGRTAKRLGLQTLFIVTHWDYFSKKGLFRFFPDKVYLWGDDMLNSALRHGDYPSDMFSIVGAPQFQKYMSGLPTREDAARRLGLDVGKKWLLYAAPSLPFDDISILYDVNRYIDEFHQGLVGIIFRPHPRGQGRKSRLCLRIEDLSNVTLDTPLPSSPEVDQHYLDLLTLCSGLISPWSTMVLEFGLLGRPSLCLSFLDGVNDYDWQRAESSDHVRALLSRKTVLNCTRRSNLRDKLLDLIAVSDDVNQVDMIRQSIGLAVYSDSSTYSERLLCQVERDFLLPSRVNTSRD